VDLDKEDGRLANFFWADGQSIMDYSSFGDVISFDTIFSTNKSERPFAHILGVNHHKQTIVFGAVRYYSMKEPSRLCGKQFLLISALQL
jgi:zinc finger SWIM domain-containing protein 3